MRLLARLLVLLAALLLGGCTLHNLSPFPSRASGVPATGQSAEQRDGEGGLFSTDSRRLTSPALSVRATRCGLARAGSFAQRAGLAGEGDLKC